MTAEKPADKTPRPTSVDPGKKTQASQDGNKTSENVKKAQEAVNQLRGK